MPSAVAPADRGGDVATLLADAGDEDRQVAGDLAHRGELRRVGRPDDQSALAELGPAGGDHLGDTLVQRAAGDVEVLQLARAGVARPADGEHRAAGEQRLGGVGAEVRVVGRGVGAVAPEHLAGVELGGRADVAALGIEQDRDAAGGGP